jgi:type VI protein secretion system component Hcp
MRKGRRSIIWALALVLSWVGGIASAGADGFLELAGVEGQSGDRNHPGWIDLLSFSHGMTRWEGDRDQLLAPPLSIGSTGPGELNLSRPADDPLSELYVACVRGTELEGARIDLCAGKGRNRSCVEYVLSRVTVLSLGVDRSAGNRPSETLTLGFEKMKWYPAVPGSPLPAWEETGKREKR